MFAAGRNLLATVELTLQPQSLCTVILRRGRECATNVVWRQGAELDLTCSLSPSPAHDRA